MEPLKTDKKLLALSLLLALLIFIIDVNIPLGVAGGVPYIALVLISLWSPNWRFTLYMALLGSLLTILGFFVSPVGGELWKVLANRFLALFAIWVTATLTLHRKRSEEKKAEDALKENERKFRGIFENTAAGAVIASMDGTLLKVNEYLCNLLGYKEEELLQKTFMEITYPDGQKMELPYYEKILSGELTKVNQEERYIHKNGGIVWILLSASVMTDNDGKPEYLIALVQDITELKKAGVALAKARNKAEEATKLKDKFVNIVVHDLRSPFSSIMGIIELLSNDPKLLLSPKQRKLIDAVKKSGDRMVSMIEDILDINRFKAGKVALKPEFFDGHMMVGSVLGGMIYSVREKGINVINDVPEGIKLYADTILFSEVISNLVSNAVKFCGKGDTLTLFVPSGRPTTIAVKDTGSGIDERMLPDLFKIEVKTTTLGSSDEQGSGLGLPYSYDIMQAHGGSLEVVSAKGEGSIFYAQLPYVKPKVLIVDDEKADRQMLTLFLNDLNVDIFEAENGRTALEAIEDNTPHLIISDIEMPVMDGFTLLEEIRDNEEMKSIP
ncbi:MAG: PAS domain S-box protein, partial [Candidatus Marinimicrobia bacterium]|nr:PAS domain S-box protein [Candidatus Neomarinimicrobiota bacterium]